MRIDFDQVRNSMGDSLRPFLQLLLLAAATWLATYSRSAIGPLQETIRLSRGFSDNQMALLQSLAMALPTSLGAIPLGMLADRWSRMRLIQCSAGLAAAALLFAALGTNFFQLFAARCLTGLATAALLIPTYSMVSDLYGPAKRGRATMVLVLGETMGAPVAFALGGSLVMAASSRFGLGLGGANWENWRWALLAMGLLIVPILSCLLLLRDVPRMEVSIKRPSLRELWGELWIYRAVALPMLLARCLVWTADGAVIVWAAPNFARRFHLSPDRVGATMGTLLLVSGLLGPALGGPLADFCQKRGGPRRTIIILAGLALVSSVPSFFALMPSVIGTAIMLTLFLTLGFAIATAGGALSLIVLPNELRGSYLGISIAVGSLVFVGLAPLVVSETSSLLGGEAMIGRALTIVCAAASVSATAVFVFFAPYFPEKS
jgi:MFS family permease